MFLRPNYRSKDGKDHPLRSATRDAGRIVTQSPIARDRADRLFPSFFAPHKGARF
jgi:hypothetical protein